MEDNLTLPLKYPLSLGSRLKVRPYQFGDRTSLTVRPEQNGVITALGLADMVNKNALSFTYDGRVILIAGLHMCWSQNGKSRAVAWALVGDDVPRRAWARIFAFAQLFLKHSGVTRIEAYTPMKWPQAVNTLEHLDFECENIMQDFGPDGDYMIGVWRG